MVQGVENDPAGLAKWLTFLETNDAPLRKVRLEYVRDVREGSVRLAGPREGYHITRLHQDEP